MCDPVREQVVPLPPDLDPLLGVYVAHLGLICANGLHAAADLGGAVTGPGDLGADLVRLSEKFHHNGLTLRCARIGRVPRGLAAYGDRHRLSAVFRTAAAGWPPTTGGPARVG